MGWPLGWVGLGWVGSSSVKYDSLPNCTGKYYSCNHEYFLIPITFIFRKFSVNYELAYVFHSFLPNCLQHRNKSRVMIKTGPAWWTQFLVRHKWHRSDIASGRRISTVGWSFQVHPLHLNQLCPVGERLFSGQPYHYWRSFKAVVENCRSNGTCSLGSAWFTA